MKIAVIEPSGGLYGSEFCLLDILGELSGNHAFTIYLPKGAPFEDRLENLPVRVRATLPGVGNGSRLAKTFSYFKLVFEWMFDSPDLVYLNQAGAIRPIGLLCHILRLPLVCQVQTLEDAHWVNRNPFSWKQVRSFICNSRYIERSLLVPENRKSTLYQGYEWKGLKRREPRGGGKTFRVGLLGRISASKGHFVLVEAVKEIVAAAPDEIDWRFVIIGSGKTRKEEVEFEEAIAKAGLAPYFEMRGYRSDIASELASLHVLVVPSLAEPLGRVLFESAEAQLPVLTSDAGGLGEVGRHFQVGSQFKSGSASDLANRLRSIRGDYAYHLIEIETRGTRMLEALNMGEYGRVVANILKAAGDRENVSVTWFGREVSPGARDAQELCYFSNLPYTRNGGGTYVVSASVYDQVERQFPGSPYHRLAVAPSLISDWRSRFCRRVLRLPSDVPQYTNETQAARAAKISRILSDSTALPFFKGVTPWAAWQPDRPYFIYTDVGFATLGCNRLDREVYRKSILNRIFAQEREFLAGATAVFFESKWGAEQTMAAYDLPGNNFHPVGRDGIFPVAAEDVWRPGTLRLVTIAKHFEQKGGDIVAQAFVQLKKEYPGLTWHIIGGPPTFDPATIAGVKYEEFLYPDSHADLSRYKEILQNAFLLIHPSREDTNPLVITEAAAFGCPCVSVADFAIPELVKDGESGLLLRSRPTGRELAKAIRSLIDDPDFYLQLRQGARLAAIENGDWNTVGKRIFETMQSCIAPFPEDNPEPRNPPEQRFDSVDR